MHSTLPMLSFVCRPRRVLPPLIGSAGVRSHYDWISENYEEIIVPMHVLTDDESLLCIMETHFLATTNHSKERGVGHRDWKIGDLARMTVWVHYQMEGEKMKNITCNMYNFEFFGSERKVEEALAESWSRASAEMKALRKVE